MKALRLTASTVVFLSVIASTMLVFSQASTEGAAPLPKTHRFHPPETTRSMDTSAAKQSADSGSLSDSVVQQINALEQDKESRTATQNKISSHLLYTARMLQGQAAAPGIPVLHTNAELDEQNNL